LNIAKSTICAASVAILLTAWLVGGCKEAVEPIEPVHQHGEGEDMGEQRRSLQSPEDRMSHAPGSPPVPLAPEPGGGLPDLDEALKLTQSSDSRKVESGFQKMGILFEKGTSQQRAAARQALREILLHNDKAYNREQAVEQLGLRFEETYLLLIQALDQEDADVVVRIIQLLQTHPEKPAIVRSVRKLLDHSSYKVRTAAADAVVGMYQATGDVAGLASLLGVHENDLSAKAAIKLTVMGRKVVPELIDIVKTSSDVSQRHGAALVLAMVCGGTTPKQDKFADLALAKNYALIEMPGPPDRRAVEPLIDALLHDESAMVREIAAQGLGYLGDAQATPALAQALTKDPSEPVRRRAAAALITVPARAAQPALEQAVRTDKSEYVRRYAAEALGWIGTGGVVSALTDAARDEAPEVRRYAAVQLGKIAEEKDLPEEIRQKALVALVGLFDDENADVRWAAVMSVGKMRDRAAVAQLRRALDDPVTMVSHAAERALQKLGLAERRAEEFKQ